MAAAVIQNNAANLADYIDGQTWATGYRLSQINGEPCGVHVVADRGRDRPTDAGVRAP